VFQLAFFNRLHTFLSLATALKLSQLVPSELLEWTRFPATLKFWSGRSTVH